MTATQIEPHKMEAAIEEALIYKARDLLGPYADAELRALAARLTRPSEGMTFDEWLSSVIEDEMGHRAA